MERDKGAGGLRPSAPPKKALRALGCSGRSPFLDRATCPGQLPCLGQNVFSEFRRFFEQATCPGQLRCLGQNFFSKIEYF